ncbi:ABC transporter permease [Methanoregula sp.]|uniref:ABC transporter permease n=1 Tax=Methanoregula sp. TaxID=2052170 RepID=UPI00260F3B14|nr:ABC transporter permease [Methanoregula sp.]MDD5142022.1 ABC transporter permease [Methanoregula sp.]
MTKDIILQLSIRSIRLNFLRSLLAALGIVIGVVAISSMGMMGANMTLSVTEELSAMANVLVVKANANGGGGGMMGPGGGGSGGSSSSDDDYISKDQLDDIDRAVGQYGLVYPLYQDTETIEVGDNEGRATIYGLRDEDMATVLTVEEGALPKTTSSVVVGPSFAERHGLTIGSRITIGDEDDDEAVVQKVRVVGILEEKGMSMDMNTDNAIVMPEKTFVGLFGGESEYDQVNVILNDINDADTATEAIENQLNRKEDEITVQDSSRMMESITSTVSTLTTFVMAIAAISLLVAATSIFNVMMMSVTERIREIGILRSIGTRKNEVLRMFIYEAVILGLVGAAIGAIMSLVLGWLVVLAMVGTTKYFFTFQSLIYVPMAMLIGIAICIFSGVYPAWRAANLDPIEALRSD